ncbi:MAG: Rpn family recombination-promoting nuclease/putative transposase, partial [Methylococcales bacterium]
DYFELTPVVAITITDFMMFDELPDVVNRFKLRAKANPEICQDDLELVFAELPKFTRTQQELTSVLDKWLYFLKTAPDLNAVPPVLAEEAAIVHAFNIANKAGLTPEELEDQERREIFIQDQRGALMLAEQRGEKRGEKRGEERGYSAAIQEVARQLLDILDDPTIAAKTGLSVSEVQQLRNDYAQS